MNIGKVKFETNRQLRDYVAGEKVECLECGNMFVALGNHLRQAHSMDCHEYREKYSIPNTMGLCSAYLSYHISKKRKDYFSQLNEGEMIGVIEKLNRIRVTRFPMGKALIKEATKNALRERASYAWGIGRSRLVELGKNGQYDTYKEKREIFFETMRIYGSDSESCKVVGIPRKAIRAWLASDIEFRTMYKKEKINLIGFAKAAASSNMESTKIGFWGMFEREERVISLVNSGYAAPTISKDLGIKKETIYKIIKRNIHRLSGSRYGGRGDR